MSAANVQALDAYAGKYGKTLIASLINELDAVNDMMVMPNVKSKQQMPKLTVKPGVRPFSSVEEFLGGDLEYSERWLEVDKGKRELLIDLEAYRNTFLAEHMLAGSGAGKSTNPSNVPFAQFTMQQIIKSVAQEINDEIVYKGFDKTDVSAWSSLTEYNAGDLVTRVKNNVTHYWESLTTHTDGDPATDDGTNWINVSARAVVPGIKSLIDGLLDDELIAAETCGAVTTGATALTAMRTLYRSAPAAYKNKGIVINVSYTDYEYLLDGIEDKLSKYTREDVTQGKSPSYVYLPGTNMRCVIKPVTWLGDSRRMIAGPLASGNRNANLFFGTDLLSDMNEIVIKTEGELWRMKMGISFVLGFQIADTNALWINEQE